MSEIPFCSCNFDMGISYTPVFLSESIGLFHFLSVQGDGRKVPGLVKSMNFQWSTAKSPKIPGDWQHFATKFVEIGILL